ncbi:type III-B CRISPR module RAMP protein Cmr4 [Okeania sp. SIO2B3]|uniref:type III-B CRISPR module RAMP protein Cmr4 n=1 Tax=Okeania sp. SIO2B3 TaxID=2607784 RepID=UPI0013C02C7B|nr:type III-B CRISPR module RAMP protein Cmr4 [Okeania sp. SIO2B3]NET45365.1 type III-B CRISPR module RAMP protein Cmr4 [Okeania sp. SIO2B3]
MKANLGYLYLLSPLHTGGTSQEGNIVGIAREVHTDLPYLPSSTIRGRLRAATSDNLRNNLWGNTLEDVTNGGDENLTQGKLWVGDAFILWFPVPSLSHGVVWITSPFLLRRWLRLVNPTWESDRQLTVPSVGSFSGGNKKNLYLKDAIFDKTNLQEWKKDNWQKYIPGGNEETKTISNVLIISDEDCQVLIQSSLWRQVKIKLDEKKSVDGGFRYEEAIPPETVMFFPWGKNTIVNGTSQQLIESFKNNVLKQENCWQFGGQESLGRGFVELWSN